MSTLSSHLSPEIAILGHPNEGKSSVLSTLAEDDSVRVSHIPGETIECRTFPVRIDGREVLRFTDTPGFQNPARVLAELRKLSEHEGDSVIMFRQTFGGEPDLRDDVELLLPVERGAGIIYVVDGSRPVRNVDREEMEILRLTGRPRMAIINCKDDQYDYLESWKKEFRKNFNANRTFNAHRATYAERILLLEALKSIDQDWQPLLDQVVSAFKTDWQARNRRTVDLLIDMFADCLRYTVSAPFGSDGETNDLRTHLMESYHKTISMKERESHQQIRTLFKHNIFNYALPTDSLLNEDLFSERTWHLLGLTKNQVTLVGGLGGAAIGAGLDLAAAGISFGLFTTLGSAVGALGALFGGKKLTDKGKILGMRLGGEQLKVGPAQNLNMLFILINRALLFYRHTINWAHGRRDYQSTTEVVQNNSAGFTASWSSRQLKVCRDFFKEAGNEGEISDTTRSAFAELMLDQLTAISSQE